MSSAIHTERDPVKALPSDLTFHDLIRRNKRNSVLLVIAMAVLVIVVVDLIVLSVGAYMGAEEPLISWQGLVIATLAAVAVVIGSSTWSYFAGGKTLLRISGAKPIEKSDDPQLYNVVEELSIAAGQPMPRVHLIDSQAMNAFATGRDPEHAAVAITTGLRQRLNRDELAGVMAHEIAHVRHYDIRLTMLVATLVGLIVLACDVFLRTAFYGSLAGGSRRGGKGKGGGAVILIVIALVLAIVAPLLAKLIQLAISRQREYLADAGAVELTRYPQGLADALGKLSSENTPLESANRATAHMYIVNPILNARGKQNLSSMFSTHPPAQERIRRLIALTR